MHLTKLSVRLIALLTVIAGVVLAFSSVSHAPRNVEADAGVVLADSITCSDHYLFTTFKGGPPPDVGPQPFRTGKTITRTVVDTATNTVKWSASVSYLNPAISAEDPEAGKTLTATTCDEELNGNRLNPSNKYSIINLNTRGTGDPAVLVKKFIEDGIVLINDPNNPARHACNDGDDNGPDGDGIDAGDANDCNAGPIVPALEDFGCTFSAGLWNALSTNTILTPVGPGHTRGVGVLYLDIDSPKDADPANCTEADALNSAAFAFGFTSEIFTRTITKGPPTALDDDWDGDGCSDWDELGAPNAPSQSSVVLGRDPFNPEDCDKNFTGVFNIAATINEAVKKYDPTLSEDDAGADTCGDTIDNILFDGIDNDGQNGIDDPGEADGADAQDPDCYTVNPGNYVQCIMALNHDKETKVVVIDTVPTNVQNISGAITCYGNTPLLGGLAGSALPSFANGLSPSSGPPPPYATASPQTFNTGLFFPDTNELQFPICFRLGGAVLGPNIIAVFTLDGKSLKGSGELFVNQSSAACAAGVPKGVPFPGFEGFDLLMAEQEDKFDHDSDGCSDLEEMLGGTKYQTITGNEPVGKCGDDPYNPYDSDADANGMVSIQVTQVRADWNKELDELIPGSYFHCIANNTHDLETNNITSTAYCYTDNVMITVNCEVVAGNVKAAGGCPATANTCPPAPADACGDGLPGSPPPAPFGDVDGSHATGSGTYDKKTNVITIDTCFQDIENPILGPAVYARTEINIHTGLGTLFLWTRVSDADCKAGNPQGLPSVAPLESAEQPPDWDSDLDGCTNAQELGQVQATGGLRDPYNRWDLMDMWVNKARDRRVNIIDIGAIVNRFGDTDNFGAANPNRNSDPLDPPQSLSGYHSSADRSPPLLGSNLWNLGPPDGQINIIEIGEAVAQFGHTCA